MGKPLPLRVSPADAPTSVHGHRQTKEPADKRKSQGDKEDRDLSGEGSLSKERHLSEDWRRKQ